MTGEMHHISQDGADDSGHFWHIHAAIAKALRADGLDATLQPFDQYQGPYVVVGKDVRVGQRPYQVAVQNMGVVRLWVQIDEAEVPCVYREDTDESLPFFWWDNIEGAIACAKELLTREPEELTSV